MVSLNSEHVKGPKNIYYFLATSGVCWNGEFMDYDKLLLTSIHQTKFTIRGLRARAR